LAVLLRCCRFISFADNTSTVSPLTLLFNLEMSLVIVVSFPIRFLATPFNFVLIMETDNCSCSPFIDSIICNASKKLVKFSALPSNEAKAEDFEMYIIPSLSQDLYLGIDFWSSFELLPPAMRVEELSCDSHILTNGQ